MLGEIAVEISEISAIVAAAEEVVEQVNEIMRETRNIIKTLRVASEGEFAEKLDLLGIRLLKIFAALIFAFRYILDEIKRAIKLNESTDREGAALLANAMK